MIQNLPMDGRPREKLIQEGPHCLTDAELIAIILRTGTRGKSAVELAQELLNAFGELRGLLASDFSQLREIKGLGPAKYAQIAAIKTIAQRSLKAQLKSKPALSDPMEAKEFLLSMMRDYQHEVFACLLLNSRNQLIRYEELFAGTIDGTNVHPREVVKLVLRMNAASVIFAHNHPSGDHRPSTADQQITRRLKQALELVDVRVLDHIIVGETTLSMAEQGWL